jgi:hypothetical protein
MEASIVEVESAISEQENVAQQVFEAHGALRDDLLAEF